MEKEFRLSKIKEMELSDTERKAIGLIDNAAFKFFLKFVLRNGELKVSPEGSEMNGKAFPNSFITKDQMQKMKDHDIVMLSITKGKMVLKMKNNEGFTVILD